MLFLAIDMFANAESKEFSAERTCTQHSCVYLTDRMDIGQPQPPRGAGGPPTGKERSADGLVQDYSQVYSDKTLQLRNKFTLT